LIAVDHVSFFVNNIYTVVVTSVTVAAVYNIGGHSCVLQLCLLYLFDGCHCNRMVKCEQQSSADWQHIVTWLSECSQLSFLLGHKMSTVVSFVTG